MVFKSVISVCCKPLPPTPHTFNQTPALINKAGKVSDYHDYQAHSGDIYHPHGGRNKQNDQRGNQTQQGTKNTDEFPHHQFFREQHQLARCIRNFFDALIKFCKAESFDSHELLNSVGWAPARHRLRRNRLKASGRGTDLQNLPGLPRSPSSRRKPGSRSSYKAESNPCFALCFWAPVFQRGDEYFYCVRRVEPPTGGTPLVIPPQIARVFGGYRKERGIHPTSMLFLNAAYGLPLWLESLVSHFEAGYTLAIVPKAKTTCCKSGGVHIRLTALRSFLHSRTDF
jgi:hypothetical protein